MGPSKLSDSTSAVDVEDLIHNFLIIMLEHSMRQKDGWKVDIYLDFLLLSYGNSSCYLQILSILLFRESRCC